MEKCPLAAYGSHWQERSMGTIPADGRQSGCFNSSVKFPVEQGIYSIHIAHNSPRRIEERYVHIAHHFLPGMKLGVYYIQNHTRICIDFFSSTLKQTVYFLYTTHVHFPLCNNARCIFCIHTLIKFYFVSLHRLSQK